MKRLTFFYFHGWLTVFEVEVEMLKWIRFAMWGFSYFFFFFAIWCIPDIRSEFRRGKFEMT